MVFVGGLKKTLLFVLRMVFFYWFTNNSTRVSGHYKFHAEMSFFYDCIFDSWEFIIPRHLIRVEYDKTQLKT